MERPERFGLFKLGISRDLLVRAAHSSRKQEYRQHEQCEISKSYHGSSRKDVRERLLGLQNSGVMFP
jgi:hypothetical protein